MTSSPVWRTSSCSSLQLNCDIF